MKPPTFADRLRALRQEAGLSAAELAERAGLARTYVHNLESGRRPNPSWELVLKLAAALGCTPDDFQDDKMKVATDSFLASPYGTVMREKYGWTADAVRGAILAARGMKAELSGRKGPMARQDVIERHQREWLLGHGFSLDIIASHFRAMQAFASPPASRPGDSPEHDRLGAHTFAFWLLEAMS